MDTQGVTQRLIQYYRVTERELKYAERYKEMELDRKRNTNRCRDRGDTETYTENKKCNVTGRETHTQGKRDRHVINEKNMQRRMQSKHKRQTDCQTDQKR
jgi:hypothetical protein